MPKHDDRSEWLALGWECMCVDIACMESVSMLSFVTLNVCVCLCVWLYVSACECVHEFDEVS